MKWVISLIVSVLLCAPAFSANLLSPAEGDFEAPGSTGWTMCPLMGGGDIIINGTTFDPGGAITGSYYGSVENPGIPTGIWAQLDKPGLVDAGDTITLEGVYAGGYFGFEPLELYIQLLDGASLIDELRIPLLDSGGFGWTPFSIGGITSSGDVSIKAGYTSVQSYSTISAIHMDSLVLTPEPTSLSLACLAGLLLLHRRG